MANAQANLNVTSTNSKSRLSTSCPSLNESCEAIILDDNTSNTTDNSTTMQDRNKNRTPHRNKMDNNANTSSKHRKTRQTHTGRHRSVSVSSGDSDDDETDTVDGTTSQKIRQKKAERENSSSVAAKSSTPPSFKESRFFHGSRQVLANINRYLVCFKRMQKRYKLLP